MIKKEKTFLGSANKFPLSAKGFFSVSGRNGPKNVQELDKFFLQ
jgi:hypothetical protein